MKIAYSYVRFSSKKQEFSDSIRRQKELSTRYAKDNKLILDDSLKLDDTGVSAFRSKNAKVGKLAAFLQAIEDGRIAPQSVLLVESLDRLSRAEVPEALELFLGILRRGVEIHTLKPQEVFTQESIRDLSSIITAIVVMSRANEESQTKSYRVKAARNARIEKAKQGKGLVTTRVPAWLTTTLDGQIVKVPERVKLIREIFDWAKNEGLGQRAIAKRLNSMGIPQWSPRKGSKGWGWAYIRLILTDRRVCGDFVSNDGQTIIPNYFPQIIDENTFVQIAAATKKRIRFVGRKGERVSNLFGSLVFDRQSGASYIYIKKFAGDAGRLAQYVTVKGFDRNRLPTFHYQHFENSFLEWCSELKGKDFLSNKKSNGKASINQIETEIAQVDIRLIELGEELESGGSSKIIVGAIRNLEAKKIKLAQALIVEKAKHAGDSTTSSVDRAKSIIEQLATVEPERLAELRNKLKTTIRNFVDRIEISIYKFGWSVWLAAKIILADGSWYWLVIATRRGALIKSTSFRDWKKSGPSLVVGTKKYLESIEIAPDSIVHVIENKNDLEKLNLDDYYN